MSTLSERRRSVAFLEHERQHLRILIAEHSVAPP